jgi:hypothetical protein
LPSCGHRESKHLDDQLPARGKNPASRGRAKPKHIQWPGQPSAVRLKTACRGEAPSFVDGAEGVLTEDLMLARGSKSAIRGKAEQTKILLHAAVLLVADSRERREYVARAAGFEALTARSPPKYVLLEHDQTVVTESCCQ